MDPAANENIGEKVELVFFDLISVNDYRRMFDEGD